METRKKCWDVGEEKEKAPSVPWREKGGAKAVIHVADFKLTIASKYWCFVFVSNSYS